MSRPATPGPPTARRPAAAALGALGLAVALAGTALGQSPPPDADRYKIDSDRLYFARVEDDAPVRSKDENKEEYEAYNDVLLHARQFSAAELEAHADRQVTFLDLVKPVRKDYQFKLLYFEGRLKLLRRLEPTKPLAAAGVKDLYEGWMFPRNGTDPMCVLTTELPAGLEPGLEFDPPRPVAIAGYSFKLIRYEAKEADPKDPTRHRVRKAPLLMGRSFTLLPEESASDGGAPWRTTFLPGMLAVLGGITAVALGLTWLFRRGDRAARRAVADRRGNPFADPAAGQADQETQS